MASVSNSDRRLIKRASDFLLERYEPKRHHAAAAVRCGKRSYLSLHLDTSGFDVCAEASAVAKAIVAGEERIDAVVAVLWDGSKGCLPAVVPPCGDCRQLLLEYAPSADVLLCDEEGELLSVKAEELLPYPYRSQGSFKLLDFAKAHESRVKHPKERRVN